MDFQSIVVDFGEDFGGIDDTQEELRMFPWAVSGATPYATRFLPMPFGLLFALADHWHYSWLRLDLLGNPRPYRICLPQNL